MAITKWMTSSGTRAMGQRIDSTHFLEIFSRKLSRVHRRGVLRIVVAMDPRTPEAAKLLCGNAQTWLANPCAHAPIQYDVLSIGLFRGKLWGAWCQVS